MTIRELFDRSFSARGEKAAATFFRDGREETTVSFSDLALDSNRLAHAFSDMGVARGDRVVLYLDKSLVFVTACLALHKIGAVAVPLNPGFKETEMEYLLGDADPRLIISGPGREGLIGRAAPGLRTLTVETDRPYQETDLFRSAPGTDPTVDLQPGDPGMILYTSGTTGKPKGTVLTQGNLAHDVRNIMEIWEVSHGDVLCHALPLFHIHGLCYALHTALVSGAHVLILDRFSAPAVLERLADKREGRACSIFMAVPQMYVKLMNTIGGEKPDFDHVRLWASGSAPLKIKDFERIRQVFGKEPVEREGMTETGMNFSNPYRGRRKPGSIGLPLPRLEARIVDPETLKEAAPGEEGEIWLKGPSVTPGYWRRPEETAAAFVDGFFRSGDLGKVDEDGYYYITDRLKHIIISGGENISPREVEDIINRLDGVVESAVVGLPDPEWGERVAAAVVTGEGSRLSPEEVQAHCRNHLLDWKCPKEIRFLGRLPRNTMGKVLNGEVAKIFRRRAPSPGPG